MITIVQRSVEILDTDHTTLEQTADSSKQRFLTQVQRENFTFIRPESFYGLAKQCPDIKTS